MVNLGNHFLDLKNRVPFDRCLQSMEIEESVGAIGVHVNDICAALEGHDIAHEPLIAVSWARVRVLHVGEIVLQLFCSQLKFVLV